MHGFYRLNILRAFTISTLLLVIASASLVIVTNFRDNNAKDTFFSSFNHVLLIVATIILIMSEIGVPQNWFARYLPLIGPESALVTLGFLQIAITSYMLSDRHCIITDQTPQYMDKLLLATGIISGCSGLFNITACTLFRGSKAGKMRIIRRHGTPVPDTEKGSVGGYSVHEEEESTNVISTFKNAFTRAGREEAPRPAMNISGPIRPN